MEGDQCLSPFKSEKARLSVRGPGIDQQSSRSLKGGQRQALQCKHLPKGCPGQSRGGSLSGSLDRCRSMPETMLGLSVMPRAK